MLYTTYQTEKAETLTFDDILMQFPASTDPIEGDWEDEEDEDFDDQLDAEGDQHEISVGTHHEPDPEDDDHLPDDDLQ